MCSPFDKCLMFFIVAMLLFGPVTAVSQDLWLSTHQLDFGTVPLEMVNDETVYLANIGNQPFSIEGFALPDTNFYYSTATTPIVLNPLDTLSVRIYFQPQVPGLQESVFNIWVDSLTGTPADSVSLSGTGDAAPVQMGSILWQFQGGDDMWAILSPGDVDGDGFSDVVAESYDAGVPMSMDHLFMFKGNSYGTGVKIWSSRPPGGLSNSGGYGQECLATIADLTDDGIRDILLGTAWGGRSVYAIDAVNGTVLWMYDTYQDPLGDGWVYAVEPISDVNGDGYEDVLAAVGGSSSGGNRSVICFDGRSQNTGQVIWRYQMNDALLDVIALGDVTQDSISDALAAGGGNFIDNRAIAVDGASSGTGTLLWDYTAGSAIQNLGRMDDVDGDNIPEALVGSWDGTARCLSGASGAVLWTFNLGSGTTVMEVDAISDLNGDGIQDVLVGNWSNSVYVLDGSDGTILWSYPTGGDVWTVDPVGDLTGDTIPEVLAGSFDGSVYCLEGVTGNLLWSVNLGNKLYTVRGLPDLNNDGWPEVGAGTQRLYGAPTGGEAYIIQGATQIVSIGNSLALQAQRVGEGVQLNWNPPGPEVDGFNMYRLQVDKTQLKKSHRRALHLSKTNTQAARDYLLENVHVSVYDGYEKLNSELLRGHSYLDTSVEPGHTYRYVVGAVLLSGKEELSPAVEVNVSGQLIFKDFRLLQNYPNPFNPETRIEFNIPFKQHVELGIYNILGQKVKTLIDKDLKPGFYTMRWNGLSEEGTAVASGVYFYQLRAGDVVLQKKMILLR